MSEFSVQSTTQYVLKATHYRTVYWSVLEAQCCPCRKMLVLLKFGHCFKPGLTKYFCIGCLCGTFFIVWTVNWNVKCPKLPSYKMFSISATHCKTVYWSSLRKCVLSLQGALEGWHLTCTTYQRGSSEVMLSVSSVILFTMVVGYYSLCRNGSLISPVQGHLVPF